MSMNDRFREAAMWVAAHPGEQVTLTMPKDDLADALADAVEDCRWPWQLRAWVRDLANRTSGMCATCWAASETAERWEEARDEPIPQPRHGDCTDPACTCPHRVRA